jgi:hypothetical protein
VIHDGTKTLKSFGIRLKDEAFRRMVKSKQEVTWVKENMLHISNPIILNAELLGGVRIGLPLDEINSDILAAQAVLAKISAAGERNILIAIAATALVLSVI